jgi:hypothetical protein
MSYYPTIMDPFAALVLVMALNLVVVILAFFAAFKLKRFGWAFHIVSLVFLAFSPILVLGLALPELHPGEEPGPGDGMILLPLLPEIIILGSFTLLTLVFKLLKPVFAWLHKHP